VIHYPELTLEVGEMPDQPPPACRRRWFRISVRALILLVFVFAVWLGHAVHRARLQRDAVVAVERAGGAIRYDWQFQNGRLIARATPRVPRWLVDFLGIDHFGNVVAVDLRGCGHIIDLSKTWEGESIPCDTDQVLAHVGNLGRLEDLCLEGSSVSDTGLERLEGLSRLRRLNLDYTRVTDAGLAHLRGLSGLEHLDLFEAPVTDGGLAHLEGLTKLRWLSLSNTEATDAGMQALLQRIPKLRIRRSGG
jgi:internalin A